MAMNYEITAQTPKTRGVPGGLFQQVVEITFRTKPSGVIGVVDVPEQTYGVDEVDKIIANKATQLEAVQHL